MAGAKCVLATYGCSRQAKAKKAQKEGVKLERYAYFPTDLQRAAVFMDRADFLRKLQKGQHDREHRRVSQRGPPPRGGGGGEDLQEKIAALNAEIEGPRGRPPQPLRKTYAPSSAPMTACAAVPGS